MDSLVNQLQTRIDFLEERIRLLEEALAPSSIPIPAEWTLTSSEARVFAHLTTREMATKSSIMVALYSDKVDDEAAIKIVDVFVCKLRKKLKVFDIHIETVWGQGYSLRDRHQFIARGDA